MAKETWKYILYGEGMKSMAVHSSLNWLEFREFIRVNSIKTHPGGSDVVFRWGVIDFINPRIFTAAEFVDYLPALIEVK
jgi:hypothetical protein